MKKIEEALSQELNIYRPWLSWNVIGTTQYNLKMEFKIKTQAKRECIHWKDKQSCPSLEIQAKPVDGEANQAIISFLSKSFGIPKAQIHLLKGLKSKIKLFELEFHLNKQKSCLYFIDLFKKSVLINDEK